MQHTQVTHIIVEQDFVDQRLDNFLVRELKGLPRTYLYKLLRKGEIRVNKKRCKPNQRLNLNDDIRLPPMTLADPSQPAVAAKGLQHDIKAACLYEDDGLIVFNKPSGIAVHGGSGVRLGFIEAVRQTYPYSQNWELVHRIDKETSGCLMVSKKRSMLRHLHAQLRAGRIKKTYWALVNGPWKEAVKVDAPLLRTETKSGERRVKIAKHGKESLTFFKPVTRYAQATLVEARPHTGRTHQIRVHALSQGHALLGDEKYAHDDQLAYWKTRGVRRLCLHAKALKIPMKDASTLYVEAPVPSNFTSIMDRLTPQ
ncbi:MAG: RluA family pseudouridine synthase [Pseudomonadota bacterium]